MSTERRLKLGQLSELREEQERLSDELESALESLRIATIAEPIAGPLCLDAGRIRNLANVAANLIEAGAQRAAAIEKLKDELGVR